MNRPNPANTSLQRGGGGRPSAGVNVPTLRSGQFTSAVHKTESNGQSPDGWEIARTILGWAGVIVGSVIIIAGVACLVLTLGVCSPVPAAGYAVTAGSVTLIVSGATAATGAALGTVLVGGVLAGAGNELLKNTPHTPSTSGAAGGAEASGGTNLKGLSDSYVKSLLRQYGTEPHAFKAGYVGKKDVSLFDIKMAGDGQLILVRKGGGIKIPTGYFPVR